MNEIEFTLEGLNVIFIVEYNVLKERASFNIGGMLVHDWEYNVEIESVWKKDFHSTSEIVRCQTQGIALRKLKDTEVTSSFKAMGLDIDAIDYINDNVELEGCE